MSEPHSPAGLPAFCYTVSPYTGATVRIVRGESTYYGVRGRESVDCLNRALGVSMAQEAAMIGGLKHGWDSPEADPANYNPCGRYLGPAKGANDGKERT